MNNINNDLERSNKEEKEVYWENIYIISFLHQFNK